MKLTKLTVLAITSFILMTGCSQTDKKFAYEKTDKKIDHVHGAGFLENDLYVATHEGIIKHDGQNWYTTTGNNHDYMGFTMAKDAFYSSGHPAEGSNLKDPLGLIKSTDKGKTLDRLSLYGESDFHYLTAGYDSDTIYVINQESNSELKTGMYYTRDEGKTWESSKFSGIESDSIGSISAHPKKKEMIAVSTRDGLYLSNDNGNNFELMTDTFMAPAVFLLEDAMIYSTIEDKGIHLYYQNFNEKEAAVIKTPKISDKNPIMFIAASHEKPEQMAIITYANDIYITNDSGKKWKQIAKEGKLE